MPAAVADFKSVPEIPSFSKPFDFALFSLVNTFLSQRRRNRGRKLHCSRAQPAEYVFDGRQGGGTRVRAAALSRPKLPASDFSRLSIRWNVKEEKDATSLFAREPDNPAHAPVPLIWRIREQSANELLGRAISYGWSLCSASPALSP